MRRLRWSMLGIILVVTALMVPGGAWAQEQSPGCGVVSSFSTVNATSVTFSDLILARGDTVRATMGSAGSGIGQTVLLIIDTVLVDSTPFPGTVSYTVPTDGTYTVEFKIDAGIVSIDPDCTGAEPPVPPAPSCNGLPATIYVENGVIVGGPNAGAAYTGMLTGTSSGDVIVGTDGRDAIDGRAGNDTICGLKGNDTIAGASGNDTMLGGQGADKLNGGSGTDSTPDFNAAEGDKQNSVP
jgi:Ca2+-binding RTX toxin-like protein